MRFSNKVSGEDQVCNATPHAEKHMMCIGSCDLHMAKVCIVYFMVSLSNDCNHYAYSSLQDERYHACVRTIVCWI